jgi:hypothetical protein
VRLAAAPSDTRVAVADEPAATPPTTSRLGISVEPVGSDFVTARRLPEQYRGLRVASVQVGSPSHERLGTNDVIAEVLYPQPKQRVQSMDDLQGALDRLKPGEILSLLVFRGVEGNGGGTVVVNIRVN